MKYYLLNKEEVIENIWVNPILIKTKSLSKINKYRKLTEQVKKLRAQILKEYKETNNTTYDDYINLFLEKGGVEITSSEYNRMKPVCLYDRQEQRISAYAKTTVLKGKLYGNKIRLD